MRWISFSSPKNVSVKNFRVSKLLNEQCIHIKLILDHTGLIHEISSFLETFFVSISDLRGGSHRNRTFP